MIHQEYLKYNLNRVYMDGLGNGNAIEIDDEGGRKEKRINSCRRTRGREQRIKMHISFCLHNKYYIYVYVYVYVYIYIYIYI